MNRDHVPSSFRGTRPNPFPQVRPIVVFRTLLLTSLPVSASKVPRFFAEARNRGKVLPVSGKYGRGWESQASPSQINFAMGDHESALLQPIDR